MDHAAGTMKLAIERVHAIAGDASTPKGLRLDQAFKKSGEKIVEYLTALACDKLLAERKPEGAPTSKKSIGELTSDIWAFLDVTTLLANQLSIGNKVIAGRQFIQGHAAYLKSLHLHLSKSIKSRINSISNADAKDPFDPLMHQEGLLEFETLEVSESPTTPKAPPDFLVSEFIEITRRAFEKGLMKELDKNGHLDEMMESAIHIQLLADLLSQLSEGIVATSTFSQESH